MVTGSEAAPSPGQETPALLGVERSLTERRWNQRAVPARLAEAIAAATGVPLIVGHVLAARGIDVEQAAAYLAPSLKADLPDPSVLADMDTGAERIARAVRNGENIAVFGDYDVDGATSSAVLYRFLCAVGLPPLIYIPDRQKEGYGPSTDAFMKLKAKGAALVITVDCGILAFDPLRDAAEAGLEVIVVDHHKAEPVLPEAVAVINPNRLDDASGLGHLAAVGVAYLLAIAVNRALRRDGYYDSAGARTAVREPDLRLLLDLVALGTVCDMVPLTGLNRTLVAQGLKIMAGRRNAGLVALGDAARIHETPAAYHLGFLLGPRVNAGGRVGEAELGARLLTTDDSADAARIAAHLDTLNTERRAIEAGVLEEALAQVESLCGPGGVPDPVIVAAGQGWHAGVIGIVASRLKDRYNRPSVVIALDEDGGEAKGSARSIAGVDLGAAIIDAHARGLLIKGGGHAMAAGLTIAPDAIDAFTRFLTERLSDAVAGASARRGLMVDGMLSVSGCGPDLVEAMGKAGPYGIGNPEPRFLLADVALVDVRRVGDSHVRAIVKDHDGSTIKVMAFRVADEPLGAALLTGLGRRFHMVGRLKLDHWTGRPKVEMTLEDAAVAAT